METKRLARALAGVAAGICLLWLTGCTAERLVYKAAALPPQYAAIPPSNPHMFNLSRLAQSTARAELLYPGDVLEVTIATGLEVERPPNWLLRITETGELTVPLVGSVPVVGMELVDCEEAIRRAAVERGQFIRPNVTVALKDRKKNLISVTGAVKEPGEISLPVGQSDLFNAIMLAGGLTDDAAPLVEVRHPGVGGETALASETLDPSGNGLNAELAGFRPGRGRLPGSGPRQHRFDLREITAGANGDFHLEDGSTVVVTRTPKQYIQVIGLVRKSDQFEMKPGQELRLLDAIALANGRTLEMADKVRVIRRQSDRAEPTIIEASVRRAKQDGAENLVLAPGDVVSVEETPLTFLVGTIREFVRFGFTSGIPGI